jgi:hypothetical protein
VVCKPPQAEGNLSPWRRKLPFLGCSGLCNSFVSGPDGAKLHLWNLAAEVLIDEPDSVAQYTNQEDYKMAKKALKKGKKLAGAKTLMKIDVTRK